MEADATAIAPAAQPMRALRAANEVRTARAAINRIGAGEPDAAEVVFTCPWMAETMYVGELLRSQKRWGRARVQKLLGSVELSETKTLNALTQRQRMLLSELLSSGCRAVGAADQLFLGEPRGGPSAAVPTLARSSKDRGQVEWVIQVQQWAEFRRMKFIEGRLIRGLDR